MIEAWRKQFSLKQLSLEHDKPITFIVSQWQKEPKPSAIYLIYRWMVALFFLVTFILSIIDIKHPEATDEFRAKWLVYLTNWGYTACTLQTLLAATLLTISITFMRKSPRLIHSYKAYWVLNIIATDIALGITALYWSLIYDEKTMDFDAMNFFVHGNNSILMMLDLFIVSHPIRLLQCCYPVGFGVCYAIFSLVYYEAGGTSKSGEVFIYKILDWRKPGLTTAICFAVLGFMVVVHIAVWGMHKSRIWIHYKYCMSGDQKGLEGEPEPTKMAYVNEGMASDVV